MPLDFIPDATLNGNWVVYGIPDYKNTNPMGDGSKTHLWLPKLAPLKKMGLLLTMEMKYP